MGVKAFVLIETGVGRTKEVVTALGKVEGVKSADAVTGPYDIIATIEALDLEGIGSLVTGKIHPIPGVSRTITCPSIGLS
jgi:DNA-binding Lrp family transcriptional regulator